VLPADAGFHAQQCAWKALKALLVHLGIPFPRTQVPELLLDLADYEEADLPVSVGDVAG
jgi:HEPN domain-containing protein